MAAVGNVFAKERSAGDPLLVGSTKTNFGHGEGASALASIMKVVLSLEHAAIPPIYDLQTLNPNIDFEAAAVKVVENLTPWPSGCVRRASINSFGYGGANAHCIIDHVHTLFPDYIKPGVYAKSMRRRTVPRNMSIGLRHQRLDASSDDSTDESVNGSIRSGNGSVSSVSTTGSINHDELTNQPLDRPSKEHRPIKRPPRTTRVSNATTRQLVLLPFAAHNKDSLKLNIESLHGVIDGYQLADVAYTLSSKRSMLPQRTFRIVDKSAPAEGLTVAGNVLRSPLQSSSIGFVFTGQGAQWASMGSELFEYRIFRATISYLDHVLYSLRNSPEWTLHDVLSGKSDPELIHKAEVSQTVCTALQVGLVDLLASWSIRPVAVAGHSSGEIAAAYASGRITAAEAIVTAYLRGQVVSQNPRKGSMLAIGLGPGQVAPYLVGHEGKLCIAAYNSPGSVTVSGDAESVSKLSEALSENQVFNRILKTGGNAYHSHHMLPLGIEYDSTLSEGLAHIKKLGLADDGHRYPKIRWASSVAPSEDVSETEFTGPKYWRANLESPVRFIEAIKNLVSSDEVQVLVEIGPHPALKSPVEQILKEANKTSITYGSTLKRQQDGREGVLQLAGTLFCLNTDVNLVAVNALDSVGGLTHGSIATDLPPYQYAYGPLMYHESRPSKEYRHREVIRHDLLGSKVVGTAKSRPQWRNILRTKDVPWLADHRLLPDAILPAAAYIAMIVEASARAHNESSLDVPIAGYSLRDVSIKSSLRIPEDDYGIEVVTSMEISEPSTLQSLTWATFSISSVTRDPETWTEHCTGRVQLDLNKSNTSTLSAPPISGSGKFVDAKSWYKKFEAIGLGYGPTFRPLSDIRAVSEGANQYSASLALKTTAGSLRDESPYLLHPASIDGAIQLALIACHNGRIDEASTAYVPVEFPHLYLSSAIPQTLESSTVVAEGERRGLRGAYLDFSLFTPGGQKVLEVEGLRATSYSRPSQTESTAFRSPLMRLQWKPDIRSLNNNQLRHLFPPPPENVNRAPLWGVVNELAYAIVYNIYETFVGDNATEQDLKPSGEVGHFFEWIKRRGTLDDNEIRREFKLLSQEARLARIDTLVSQAPQVIEVQTSKLLHDNMNDILSERRTGIDIIISKGLLTPLYQEGLLMTGIYPQLFNVVNVLGHVNPNMKYIEIGGGTGGATRIAMKALRGPNGIKSYRDYTFTDISPGFLNSAREGLSDSGFDDMIYNVLDAEQDPLENGYTAEYDVVIACQVLHATSCMNQTLKNVGKLLKPGGKLVLVETTENFMVPGVVVGTFTGYWAGIPDGRFDAPFMSLEMWDENLKAAGFSGAELVLDDFPHPHNTTSIIVSTFNSGVLTETENEKNVHDVIHLLHSAEIAPSLAHQLSQKLQELGFTPQISSLRDSAKQVQHGSRVVTFLDDSHVRLDDDEQDLVAFQHLAKSTSALTVLTSCGIAKGRNPDGALIPGMLRVLKTENPASHFLSIDIDADNFGVESAVSSQLTHCLTEQVLALDAGHGTHDETPVDREFVWQDGALWVSRYTPVPEDELPVSGDYYGPEGLGTTKKTETLTLESQHPVLAAFETPGVLGSLYFTRDKDTTRPLPSDHIEVKMIATGLDFDDLEIWSGRVDTIHNLMDYSGIITKLGASVCDLKVGDHVYGLVGGRFQVGTYARVPANLAIKLQPNDDAIQMATLPRTCLAVIHAFENIVSMPADRWKDKNVLIESATSDVGLAAVDLAIAKGANVFASVNTPEEATTLSSKTGLALSNITCSVGYHTVVSQKGGFDIILSIRQREQESLKELPRLLAPMGHLIYIGSDIGPSPHSIDLPEARTLLQKNATFSSIDLPVLLATSPALGRELLGKADIHFRKGTIKASNLFLDKPVDVTALPEVLPAYLKSEGRLGKLLVTFEDLSSPVKMATLAPSVQLDSEAAYIITGGLGGLGQSILRWMVNHGARHLIILSRRPIAMVPDAQQLINGFANCGVDVSCVVCDVTDLHALKNVVDKVSSVRSLKGIIHAAVSWRDLSFDKISPARWRESLAAKVQGTKNLHEATLSLPLDFFIMTTSLLSVYALATQAAYTAANNFQDAFARYRRAQGLPAAAISFSLIRDVGATGSNASIVDTFARNGTVTLNEKQFLALFESAFFSQHSSTESKDSALDAANLTTCLDPASMLALERDGGSSDLTPRWHGDGRVAIVMRAFNDAKQHELDQDASNATGDGKSSTSRLQQSLKAGILAGHAERSATITLVEGAITAVVADMLFIDLEAVDPARSVADYGVDSLVCNPLDAI